MIRFLFGGAGMAQHLVRALASHQIMWPGFDSQPRRYIGWIEFVVGSRPCSERFSSGYFGFPFS